MWELCWLQEWWGSGVARCVQCLGAVRGLVVMKLARVRCGLQWHASAALLQDRWLAWAVITMDRSPS